VTAAPFPDIAAWPPTRYTPPLTPDFRSAFDPWRKLFAVAWAYAFGYALEDWQINVIRAVLEIDPATGRLRWQQAVISLGRQNGKTEIAAALGLWRLLSNDRALVIGIASSREQADLVYRRTMEAIDRNPELAELFRATGTRGIRALTGSGRYEVKPAKSAALQGLPIDLGLCDELHVLPSALWGDLLSGTGARPDCIVVGITTAGDADSALLLDLYRLGEDSIKRNGAGRVFFAVWEAPEARVPEDDETLGRWLAMANPRVANGGTSLADLITIVRSKPRPDAIRYHLNRFLTSVRHPFIDPTDWHKARRGEDEAFPRDSSPVFTFDAAPGMSFVTVTATAKDAEGIMHSEVVASLRAPKLEALLALADRLAEYSPRTFAVEGYTLRAFGKQLAQRGYPVMVGSASDAIQSAALLYRLVLSGRFRHAGDPLLSQQIPRAVRKNAGDAYRIARADSTGEIDAVIATALGALVEEITPNETGLQIYV